MNFAVRQEAVPSRASCGIFVTSMRVSNATRTSATELRGGRNGSEAFRDRGRMRSRDRSIDCNSPDIGCSQ